MHSEIILELISVLITLTLTPLIVLGINFKSVIGALWGYTCTLETTLALFNCFQINFSKITLTLPLLSVFELPFESKLLPAVLLLLRIYFPKITVTVTVLKFG